MEIDAPLEKQPEYYREILNVNGIRFDIQSDNLYFIENIRNVTEGFDDGSIPGSINKVVSIRMQRDISPESNVVNDTNREVFQSSEDSEQGRLGEKYYSVSKGFGYIAIPEDKGVMYNTWGNRADLAALAIIKVELLKYYAEKYNRFSSIHGGCVIDSRDNSTIVFSGTDYSHPRGNASGKTTSVLALAINSGTPFKYVANDEVILGLDSNNNINVLPLPSMIALRSGTTDALKKEGYNLTMDEWIEPDRTTGEETVFITPKSIVNAGGETAPKGTGIRVWLFTDLSPKKEGVTIDEVPETEARRLFVTSLSFKRMNQSRDSRFMGESLRDYTQFREAKDDAESIFEMLKKTGTKFLIISGGVDRGKIYSAVKKYSYKI